jgi:hypothetical protein
MLWVMWYGKRDPYEHVATHSSIHLAMAVAEGARPAFDIPQLSLPTTAANSARSSLCVATTAANSARSSLCVARDSDCHSDVLGGGGGSSAGTAVGSREPLLTDGRESGSSSDGRGRSAQVLLQPPANNPIMDGQPPAMDMDGGQRPLSIVSACDSAASSTGAVNGGVQPVQRVAELAARCWSHQPDDRPSFAQVIRELDVLLAECSGPGS